MGSGGTDVRSRRSTTGKGGFGLTPSGSESGSGYGGLFLSGADDDRYRAGIEDALENPISLHELRVGKRASSGVDIDEEDEDEDRSVVKAELSSGQARANEGDV